MRRAANFAKTGYLSGQVERAVSRSAVEAVESKSLYRHFVPKNPLRVHSTLSLRIEVSENLLPCVISSEG